MKNKATLIHNPTAGKSDHTRKELIELLESSGYECRYNSTKKDTIDEIDLSADLIVIAGGDGTVRKVITGLVQKNVVDNLPPVGLLPLGTANNISTSLNIQGDLEEIVRRWNSGKTISSDMGQVDGTSKTKFFLESFGFGIFPSFIHTLQKDNQKEKKNSGNNLREIQNDFYKYLNKYKPDHCKFIVDGKEYSGEFLLAEVMNINFIGPNLQLAPNANCTDGFFELVLISENERELLSTYVLNKITGVEFPHSFTSLKAKSFSLSWNGTKAHADDLQFNLDPGSEINIYVKPSAIKFLV